MATNIRAIRKSKGMTQGDLALAAGINRVTIAKYETGKITPTLTNAGKIATALGVTVNDLIAEAADEASND
jgi:transcriptional regulator with XRE-family HTH domain